MPNLFKLPYDIVSISLGVLRGQRTLITSVIVLGSLALGVGSTGCTSQLPTKALPLSSELGTPRGYRVVRTITHFHSVYSFDACDNNGLPNGQVNEGCNSQLVDAMCQNHVDFLFITDHPENMKDYEMRDLLLLKTGDETLLNSSGDPYAKRVGSCSDGFKPTFLLGFESQLLALGMTKHIESTPAARGPVYSDGTNATRLRLANEADAVVVVPHTESRSLSTLQGINPDGIEIYNFHANIDPKIRKTYLSARPFDKMASFLTYLVDPYNQLVPDLGFLHFIQVFPVYLNLWNSLINSGYKITGLGGTDSHQNVLPQIVADGERLDSHRRVTRFLSNHFLVSGTEISDIKAAIKRGRGWVVFEGLGSPVGMDFYAQLGTTTVGVGDTASLSALGGSAQFTVPLPTLHSLTPQGSEKPHFILRLKKVTSGGKDVVVATAVDGSIQYTTTVSGAYRVEISVIPRHLKKYLGDFASLGENEFSWIISNHLYLDP